MKPQGCFLSLEGGDGSGKSLQIQRLAARLEQAGCQILISREPGGTPIGEAIRTLLLDPENRGMDPRTEALLYAAARAQHVSEKILPALKEGKVVILDRYIDSSLIYQGLGRELGIDPVAAVNRFATQALMPDLTFVLELSFEEGMRRKKHQEGHALDRLELEKESFHRRVNEGYHILRSLYPERIFLVDAARDPDTIHEEIWQILTQTMKEALS